ncbi:MAG: hypothetical protein GX625_19820 [Clostridiaceae bacterium]|nr:hypothetical protein [Clostridiaceae bacterium]
MKRRSYRITARFRIICAWGATAMVGLPLSAWLWNVAAIERGYAGACGGEVLVLPAFVLGAICFTVDAMQKEKRR